MRGVQVVEQGAELRGGQGGELGSVEATGDGEQLPAAEGSREQVGELGSAEVTDDASQLRRRKGGELSPVEGSHDSGELLVAEAREARRGQVIEQRAQLGDGECGQLIGGEVVGDGGELGRSRRQVEQAGELQTG